MSTCKHNVACTDYVNGLVPSVVLLSILLAQHGGVLSAIALSPHSKGGGVRGGWCGVPQVADMGYKQEWWGCLGVDVAKPRDMDAKVPEDAREMRTREGRAVREVGTSKGGWWLRVW